MLRRENISDLDEFMQSSVSELDLEWRDSVFKLRENVRELYV